MANPQSEVIGGEEENFAAMLEESFKGKGTTKGGELKENEIVRGTVVQVTKDYAVVDIGYKSEGQVPIQEFGLLEGKPNVKVGDAVEVLLESRENDTGMVVLSKEKADKMRIRAPSSAASRAASRSTSGSRRSCPARRSISVRSAISTS